MTPADLTEKLPIVFTGGAGIGAGVGAALYFFKWLFDWIGMRVDRREAAVASGAARLDKATQALIDRLQKQIDAMQSRHDQEIGTLRERLSRVEDELEECRAKHAESQAEVMQLRAFVQASGDARQTAQLIVSQERAKDREGKP